MNEIHSFNAQLAAEYGVIEALLIQMFINKLVPIKRKKSAADLQNTWVYLSKLNIEAEFVYLTKLQVNRALNRLIKANVLIRAMDQKSIKEKTHVYTFSDEDRFLNL